MVNDVCTPVFAALTIYRDDVPRSAAMNMAIDEALLEKALVPSIRFYRWNHPALSFGYFGRFTEVTEYSGRDLVRRWTGGGIVLHGDDLTYALIIPANDPAFAESSMSIYERTHQGIQLAIGGQAQLAATAASKISESCFANPVRADVMLNGRKVAGAAQRRSRRGLLQQGSIQHVDLTPDFEMRFARQLAREPIAQKLNASILERARVIAVQKYESDTWLRKR